MGYKVSKAFSPSVYSYISEAARLIRYSFPAGVTINIKRAKFKTQDWTARFAPTKTIFIIEEVLVHGLRDKGKIPEAVELIIVVIASILAHELGHYYYGISEIAASNYSRKTMRRIGW